jgi:hypothetical protein
MMAEKGERPPPEPHFGGFCPSLCPSALSASKVLVHGWILGSVILGIVWVREAASAPAARSLSSREHRAPASDFRRRCNRSSRPATSSPATCVMLHLSARSARRALRLTELPLPCEQECTGCDDADAGSAGCSCTVFNGLGGFTDVNGTYDASIALNPCAAHYRPAPRLPVTKAATACLALSDTRLPRTHSLSVRLFVCLSGITTSTGTRC